MQDILLHVKKDVTEALAEDIGTGDVSAELIPENQTVQAEIISREPMLISGQPWVNEVFRQVDPNINIQWHVHEGSWLEKESVLCTIVGKARHILSAERTALNFLQTLSATSTQTYYFIQKLSGTNTKLLDTRKTLPKLRVAQKYAVLAAGGTNHRLGLYDAFLIKENHIKACGSITKAIVAARNNHPNLFIEVEVETLNELQEAIKAKPDRILLDNFSLQDLSQAVSINQSLCTLEASGNVSLETIHKIASTGVNFISVGSITKSIKAIDLSLLIRKLLS